MMIIDMSIPKTNVTKPSKEKNQTINKDQVNVEKIEDKPKKVEVKDTPMVSTPRTNVTKPSKEMGQNVIFGHFRHFGGVFAPFYLPFGEAMGFFLEKLGCL